MPAAQVTFKEVDLSQRVPGFPGVAGGIAIETNKGPIDKPYLITNDAQLLRVFTPDERVDIGMSIGFYSAITFLTKNNQLWVQRAFSQDDPPLHAGAEVSTSAVVALDEGLAVPEDDWTPGSNLFLIHGANPGVWTNEIGVKIWKHRDIQTINAASAVNASTNVITVATALATGETFRVSPAAGATLPDGLVEGFTYYAINVTSGTMKAATSEANALAGTPVDITEVGEGNMRIVPFKEVNEPTDSAAFVIEVYKGVVGNADQVESWLVSRNVNAKDGNGQSIFIETVLERSDYIRAVNNATASGAPPVQGTTFFLEGGYDGDSVTEADMITASNHFLNSEEISLLAIMDGGYSTAGYHANLISICDSRKDCIPLMSVPPGQAAATAAVDYRRTELNINSSYGTLFSPWIKNSDRFNDRSIFIPPDGYAGAALGETALNYELWYPIAGFKRGSLIVQDVQVRYSQGEQSFLIDNGINPIRFAPNRGIVIWGQKTLLTRPSYLQELHIRLLAIILRQSLKITLEDFLHDLNDDDTRRQVVALIEDYMTTVKARKGVRAFRVVCDDSNNTDNDVDNGRLVVWLFITPITSVTEIPVTLAITNSSFDLTVAPTTI